MAINVKFLKGTAEGYTGIASKDALTFYYTTDDKNLYLGDVKLSNAADLTAAVGRIATAEGEIDAIQEQLTSLIGEGSGSIQDMIDSAINTFKTTVIGTVEEGTTVVGMIEEVSGAVDAAGDRIDAIETDIGDVDSLTTVSKEIVGAIEEVKNAVSAGGTAATLTIDTSTTTEGMAKSYTIKQGASTIGVIDIPKDMVVSSGTVEKDPADQDPGTYLVLTLANATSDKIYINVGTLVDLYTAQQSAAQVQLTINSGTREISATIVAGSVTDVELAANAVTTVKIADGNVTKAKLATAVQASLDKADSAVQSVVTGTGNGSISVDGSDVQVKGLASAAYTDSTAYDAAGSAAAVQTALENALTWQEF